MAAEVILPAYGFDGGGVPEAFPVFFQQYERYVIRFGNHGIDGAGFLAPAGGDGGGIGEVYGGKGGEFGGYVGSGFEAGGVGVVPVAVFVAVVVDSFGAGGVLQVDFDAGAHAAEEVDVFIKHRGFAAERGQVGQGGLCGFECLRIF